MTTTTEYNNLKSVVVGVEFCLPKLSSDFVCNNLHRDGIGLNEIYSTKYSNGILTHEMFVRRNAQLDNLASVLSDLGINVFRPKKLSSLGSVITPFFKVVTSSASNVRDLLLTYGDSIIEMPITCPNRTLENRALDHIFYKIKHTHIAAPFNCFNNKQDTKPWRDTRNYVGISEYYDAAIDAANCIKIGDDIICNVSNYNQYQGYLWLISIISSATFHMVTLSDNHLDNILLPLSENCFLYNSLLISENTLKKSLPSKFRDWNFVCPDVPSPSNMILTYEDFFEEGFNPVDLELISACDINVLSISRSLVVIPVHAVKTIQCLKSSGFDVVEVPFDNCELFGGGIHCSTLDLVREE